MGCSQFNVNVIEILNDEEKKKIVEEYHIKLGHRSKENMIFSIKSRYNWGGMIDDIKTYVEMYEICNKSGRPRINTKNRTVISDYPNDLWEFDLIVRITGCENTNNFIFVAVDHHSKWMEAKVLKQKTAFEVESAIRELVIEKHGIPRRILTDAGLEFKNHIIQKLCIDHNIEQIFASPGHHQTVGAVERANQTVFEIIKKLCDYGRKSWKRILGSAVEAYNFRYHRALKTFPYIFKYGKLPLFEFEKLLGEKDIEISKRLLMNKKNSSYTEYAKASIEKARVICPYNFKIGDQVLIYKENMSGELKENWNPGYTKVDFELPDAYWVSKDGKRYRLKKTYVKLNKFAIKED